MKVNQQSRHRVLVVAAELGHNSQREIAGISSFVRRAGLAVDVVDGSRFGDTPDFAKWIEFWNPGGLIVDPKYAVAALGDEAASRLPLVVWDAAESGDLPASCAMAMSDPEAIADAAVRELLGAGIDRLVFVPALDRRKRSRERGEAFVRAAASFGHDATVFGALGGLDQGDARHRCRRWLRHLHVCGGEQGRHHAAL